MSLESLRSCFASIDAIERQDIITQSGASETMRSFFNCLLIPGLLVAVLVGAGDIASATEQVDLSKLTLRTTDGQSIELPDADYTVLCFLGTECPLAKLYAGRLQELSDRFEDSGVTFVGINSNAQDSPAEIDRYIQDHGIRFAFAKDADQSIADSMGAKRTPEVFLTDQAGRVLYRGRIDDQYEPGISRKAPTTHHLADALTAVIDGKDVSVASTVSVGCLITRIRRNASKIDSSAVTFNRDIAPILNQHCVECHRQGEIAPMALTEYDEVLGWSHMILEVIDQKRMPPWHADPNVGHFVGERLFPSEARESIYDWIVAGMPEGDAADLPSQPKWAGGWHLASEPDQQFEMQRSFSVPSEGTVEYQYFVIDPGWEEDVWVQAAQVVPGSASVVHHCIVFVRPPDGSSFNGIGWLGAYVPGQRTIRLRSGHARRIPRGSKLVFQMHYTPNGHATDDRSKLGVWTIPAEQVTHQVTTYLAIEHEFEIPPEAADYTVQMKFRGFPQQSEMMGLTPHMHLRGKAFQAAVEFNDGKRQPLLNVPRYDFNWQHWYAFEKPLALDNVKSLSFDVTFDNSSGNPTNPDPQEYVSWGDQTWEEMAVAFFDIATPKGVPLDRVWTAEKPSDKQLATRNAEVDQRVKEFLQRMDKDRDGVVTYEETPTSFARFGFYRFDFNRDGRIVKEEIRKAASRR